MVRFPARRAAMPHFPTGTGSISRLWPPIIDNSKSGRRIVRRISRTAPPWWAPRSLASKADELDAQHLYEQAIRSSNANGFVQNEALANELAARFYMARGFEKIAYTYLRDARYNYLRWGAAGKVRQLDEMYPQLKAENRRLPRPARSAHQSSIWISPR